VWYEHGVVVVDVDECDDVVVGDDEVHGCGASTCASDGDVVAYGVVGVHDPASDVGCDVVVDAEAAGVAETPDQSVNDDHAAAGDDDAGHDESVGAASAETGADAARYHDVVLEPVREAGYETPASAEAAGLELKQCAAIAAIWTSRRKSLR
jgi:hypothetical protein